MPKSDRHATCPLIYVALISDIQRLDVGTLPRVFKKAFAALFMGRYSNKLSRKHPPLRTKLKC